MFLGLSRTHLFFVYIYISWLLAQRVEFTLSDLYEVDELDDSSPKNWAWEKKANVSTYHTYEREIIRFPPGPKKIAGRPERQNFLQRIQHCCWLLFSLCKNTKNILWYLSPIESCGIEWNLNHPAEVSLIPSFWCVSPPFLPRGPARRRHATPNRPFRQHSSLPKANRGPWRSQRCFLPMVFFGGEKSVRFFLGNRGGKLCFCVFFHLPIWKIWALRKIWSSFSSRGQTVLKIFEKAPSI